MNPFSAPSPRRHQEAANTLVMVLLTIAILSAVASNLMWSASARYHTTYQSASWQEALVAAEAGVNLAMVELRKRVRGGDDVAFKAPWLSGNPSLPTGPAASRPANKSLLGGALDPTSVAAVFDPVNDPARANPVSLTPAYPEYGHALPFSNVVIHGGEGNNQMWTRVYVDVPGSPPPPGATGANFAAPPPLSIDSFINEQSDSLGYDARAHWWYRIRAMGITGVSGPPRASVDNRDNLLRRLSFFTDWRSNLPVNAVGSQASRVVEVVAKPQTGFRNALMADLRIDLSSKNVLIDSFNSNNGLYGSQYSANAQPYINIGTMGNIATNGDLINAGGAIVMGNAMTNDGTVTNAQNVAGNRSSDFYQELTKVPMPAAGASSNFILDGKSLNGQTTAGTSGDISFDGAGHYQIATSSDRSAPTRVYLNGINLTNGPGTIQLKGAADHSSTYVKVIVNGDIKVNSANTDGSNVITVDNGVHAIVYVTGNVAISGAGIANVAQLADRLLINGVQPPNSSSTTPPTMSIQTTQDFLGIIYAPDHDLNLTLKVAPDVGSPDPVAALNAQIAALNAQIAKYQDDYQRAIAQPGGGNLKTAISDLAQIAALQPQVAALNQQLQALLTNILPDTAPQIIDHASGFNGIYGAIIGRSVTVGSKTHIHYDEALRQAGPVNHYTLANWVEDNASHAVD